MEIGTGRPLSGVDGVTTLRFINIHSHRSFLSSFFCFSFLFIFSSLLFSRSPNFFFGDGDSAPFYFFLKSKMEPIQRREKARNCPREDENKENETKDSTAMNRLLLFPFFLAIFALCFGRKQNGRPHLELMNDGP